MQNIHVPITGTVSGLALANDINAGFDSLQGAIGGSLSKSVAGGSDVTLSAGEANNGIIILTGLLTASINVIVPSSSMKWTFKNATTGAFELTVKTAAGSGVLLAKSASVALYCDGTDVIPAITPPSSFRADNNNVNIATIPDSTWTRIALSTERHDTNSEFASGTFTAKSAGIHRFYFQWSGAAPVANNAMRARLYKNGTEFAEGRIILVSGNQQIVSVYDEPKLAIGDTVDAYVFHNRGTNQEVHGSVLFTYFTGGFTGIAA